MGGEPFGWGEFVGEQIAHFCRFFLPVRRRNGIPDIRFPVVLRNAITIVMHYAKVVLRKGVSLFGGTAIPFNRFRLILSNPLAMFICKTEITVRGGISLFGS